MNFGGGGGGGLVLLVVVVVVMLVVVQIEVDGPVVGDSWFLIELIEVDYPLSEGGRWRRVKFNIRVMISSSISSNRRRRSSGH